MPHYLRIRSTYFNQKLGLAKAIINWVPDLREKDISFIHNISKLLYIYLDRNTKNASV